MTTTSTTTCTRTRSVIRIPNLAVNDSTSSLPEFCYGSGLDCNKCGCVCIVETVDSWCIILCIVIGIGIRTSFASFFTWILLDWFRLPASVYCLTEYVCLLSESAEPAEHASAICCETAVVCLNLLSESAV
ncbi:hypothetical protein Tco_0657979 [Tanacetum coccineum]